MPSPDVARSPGRGRPPMDVQRHVIQDLMDAAEAALASKTAKETTIREIAAAAGTNEAMIHYYFGGKDGLMMALFMDFMRNHPNTRAEKIADTCISQRTIKPLVEQLAKFYNSRPNLSRMTMSEMIVGSSKIKALYNEKYSHDTPVAIEFVIKSMVNAGIYSRKLNIKFVTMTVMSMIVAPRFLLPATQALELCDKLDSPEWIDHIVQTIDLSIGSSSN